MLEWLKLVGFIALFLRFAYWIGSSFSVHDEKWIRVLLAQAVEGLLLFFFYTQLFSNITFFPFHNIYFQLMGFFLVFVGVAIAYKAKVQLGSAWVYASSYKIVKNQPLFTSGVYKIVRHPIYAGILWSYIGIELLAGSWLWVAALFFVIPFYIQAKKEEKILHNHFGEKYKTYQSRTKMLIPFVL